MGANLAGSEEYLRIVLGPRDLLFLKTKGCSISTTEAMPVEVTRLLSEICLSNFLFSHNLLKALDQRLSENNYYKGIINLKTSP